MKSILDDCKNPFHYLLLKDNVQPFQGTCDCSARTVYRKRKLERPITEKEIIRTISLKNKISLVGQSRNQIQSNDSGLDYKYPPPLKSSVQPGIKHFFPTKTAADITREEQDRKKCFKRNSTFILDPC